MRNDSESPPFYYIDNAKVYFMILIPLSLLPYAKTVPVIISESALKRLSARYLVYWNSGCHFTWDQNVDLSRNRLIDEIYSFGNSGYIKFIHRFITIMVMSHLPYTLFSPDFFLMFNKKHTKEPKRM